MRTNKNVTIWHFGDLATPVRRIFKNVYVDTACKIDKNGIKQKGFFDAKSATVRIPVSDDIGVLPGDYLFIGECSEELPNSEDALKIVEVKDNRRGGQKHWRIVCGG